MISFPDRLSLPEGKIWVPTPCPLCMDLWVFLSILNFPFKPIFGLKPKMCIWTKLMLPERLVLMKKCPLRHCNDLLAAPVVTALSALLILTVISGAGALLGVVTTRLGVGWRGGNVQSAQGAAYSNCKLAWRSIQANLQCIQANLQWREAHPLSLVSKRTLPATGIISCPFTLCSGSSPQSSHRFSQHFRQALFGPVTGEWVETNWWDSWLSKATEPFVPRGVGGVGITQSVHFPGKVQLWRNGPFASSAWEGHQHLGEERADPCPRPQFPNLYSGLTTFLLALGDCQFTHVEAVRMFWSNSGNFLLFTHSVLSNSCDPIDCSLPGSSVHEISQARILEWVAISFFRGSSWPRVQTWVSCIGRWFSTTEPPGKPYSGNSCHSIFN